ncbi:hypothetical protein NEISICOT_00908 [Neisseria sicca ATCC 29256]|uniref:Uncharacterized protein n=1 Tax=Neisseria sicca ATCC 29256 TaxID=547045 RepID=C6M317_NEISI|nr:hypothetical protein NEISICOT_00908 [Neisseria sicca ATCC 29256]
MFIHYNPLFCLTKRSSERFRRPLTDKCNISSLIQLTEYTYFFF